MCVPLLQWPIFVPFPVGTSFISIWRCPVTFLGSSSKGKKFLQLLFFWRPFILNFRKRVLSVDFFADFIFCKHWEDPGRHGSLGRQSFLQNFDHWLWESWVTSALQLQPQMAGVLPCTCESYRGHGKTSARSLRRFLRELNCPKTLAESHKLPYNTQLDEDLQSWVREHEPIWFLLGLRLSRTAHWLWLRRSKAK